MLRLAALELEHDDTDDSVTVAEAARRLGCSASTVRELMREGELAGHRVGKLARKWGVRVHVAAIRSYKIRHAVGGIPIAEAPAPVRPVHNAGAAEARRRLRELGIL